MLEQLGIDLLQPIKQPYKLFEAFLIMCGLWLDSKLFWMIIYEIKYYPNAGLDYFRYGKRYVINKSSSNGNKPIKK